jgi:hypothetical protein
VCKCVFLLAGLFQGFSPKHKKRYVASSAKALLQLKLLLQKMINVLPVVGFEGAIVLIRLLGDTCCVGNAREHIESPQLQLRQHLRICPAWSTIHLTYYSLCWNVCNVWVKRKNGLQDLWSSIAFMPPFSFIPKVQSSVLFVANPNCPVIHLQLAMKSRLSHRPPAVWANVFNWK